jgi:alkylhydroperoxidase/carboxymuconolactone decarboxylase family protein YurZ
MGMDATGTPDWLREDTPAAPIVRDTGAGMDPTLVPFDWQGDNVIPVSSVEAAETAAGLPDWMREELPQPAQPVSAGAPDNAGGADEIPGWLREEAPIIRAVPGTAPLTMSAEPAMAEEHPADATPPPATADTTAPAVTPEAPAPVPTAPAVPAPAVSPAGMEMSALGGSPQTPESITGAVNAATSIDARTRTLLLFGMALVRLAAPEARAAAEAARRAGLTTEDLQLVVEMAQALGGGPSERLGRRILEG